MLPQCYKYNLLLYYELHQNDLKEMKFCLEARVNVLNLPTNVKQFMAELNHSTAAHSIWRVTGQNAVTSIAFSPDLMDPLYMSQSIPAGKLSSFFKYFTFPSQSLTNLDSGHNPQNALIIMQIYHLGEQLYIFNDGSDQVKLSVTDACTLLSADTDKTMWWFSVWPTSSYL